MSEPLHRKLGLRDVVAIGINSIIGTGIFFLPGRAAELLGPAAVLTFAIGGVASLAMIFCHAEAGSRFRGTGGSMLHAREAFGDLAGFSVGWMSLLTRFAAWGALSNAFVTSLDVIFPGAVQYRAPILLLFFMALAAVHCAGIRSAATATNLFTAAKLAPLVVFIGVGVFFIDTDLYRPFAPHGYSNLGAGTLLIFFAFAGFELIPLAAGEMKSPRRSVPIAMLLVSLIVTTVYLGIWAVSAGTLPGLAGSESPVSDAAAVFMGPYGALLVSLGILVSVVGVNTAASLAASRFLYALGRDGHLPRFCGAVNVRTGAPVPAILITTGITLAIALSGSFVELAVLSVVARFAQIIPTCLSVVVFRYTRPDDPPGFRLVLGPTIPIAAVLVSLWVLSQAEPRQLIWGGVALAIGWVVYGIRRIVARPMDGAAS